jgi:hypothetical protein
MTTLDDRMGCLTGRLTFQGDPINGVLTTLPVKPWFRHEGKMMACLAKETILEDGQFHVHLTTGIEYEFMCAGGKIKVELPHAGHFEMAQ